MSIIGNSNNELENANIEDTKQLECMEKNFIQHISIFAYLKSMQNHKLCPCERRIYEMYFVISSFLERNKGKAKSYFIVFGA